MIPNTVSWATLTDQQIVDFFRRWGVRELADRLQIMVDEKSDLQQALEDLENKT
jgi:hypothetical protein